MAEQSLKDKTEIGTTDSLQQSAEQCIGALSSAVCDEIERYKVLQGNTEKLLLLTSELRMDVDFVIMDLNTSFLACCKESTPYAIRYHIKNLNSGFTEAYKAIHGFGKAGKKTVWARLGKALEDSPVSHFAEQTSLVKSFHEAEKKMLDMERKLDEKEHRDLTYHYDSNMKEVYQLTVDSNNMEESSQRLIDFMGVLHVALKLCEEVEECLRNNGGDTKVGVRAAQNLDDSRTLAIVQQLRKNEELKKVLTDVLNDVKPIDDQATHILRFEKLESMTAGTVELPEIGNVFTMLNIWMMLYFMRADIAAITKAIVMSSTSGEALLNMRRYMINIVAVFGQLYGYNDNQRQGSHWTSIKAMLPIDNCELKEEAARIEELLKQVTPKRDEDLRTCYVHYYDNKTMLSNVPNIVSALAARDLEQEMQRANLMLRVMGVVRDYLNDVMTVLAKQAHDANEKSTKEVKATLEKVRAIAENDKCPEELKETLTGVVEMVERTVRL